MRDLDLAWRVEEACLNACPSPREIVLRDRWLVRIGGGDTRRVNSVNPLRAERYDPSGIIDAARTLYQAHGQPLIVRAPAIAAGLDAHLDRAGFAASASVSTLIGGLDAAPDASVRITASPQEAWLAAKLRMTPQVGARPEAYRAMLAAIALPAAFAAFQEEGHILGVGFGAIHERLLVLESIVTDAGARRRGCGRRLVATLMAWARTAGATAACLQVESGNAPALALYRALGFRDELYSYRYFSEG